MPPRSRKRGRRQRIERPARPPRPMTARAMLPTEPTPEMSRSERKNAEVRGGLEPLGSGERPVPIMIASAIAAALGVVNFVLWATGSHPDGVSTPKVSEVIVFCALMGVCAGGMWRMRYWAVLGFQALLAIGLLGFSLALIKVETWYWAIGVTVIIGLTGWLFWKLVRILGRMQLPTPPQRMR